MSLFFYLVFLKLLVPFSLWMKRWLPGLHPWTELLWNRRFAEPSFGWSLIPCRFPRGSSLLSGEVCQIAWTDDQCLRLISLRQCQRRALWASIQFCQRTWSRGLHRLDRTWGRFSPSWSESASVLFSLQLNTEAAIFASLTSCCGRGWMLPLNQQSLLFRRRAKFAEDRLSAWRWWQWIQEQSMDWTFQVLARICHSRSIWRQEGHSPATTKKWAA